MAANISTEYNVNSKEIAGNSMPNVYISRVTLQTINVPDNSRKSRINAHASDPSLVDSSMSDPTLRVVLNLEVKDIKKGSYSRWFANKHSAKLLKNMKVAVVQTTTPEATQLWANSDNVKKLLSGENVAAATDGTDIQTIDMIDFLNAQNPQAVFQFQDPEVDSSGLQVYSFKKQISFPSANSKNTTGISTKLSPNQNHLAYFVYSYTEGTDMIGRIASDIVLDSGNIISEAFVMVERESGQIWTGPFHKHEGDIDINGQPYFGFMGGESHHSDQAQTLLEQVRVKSNKVQDFRALTDIKTVPVEFSVLEKQLLEQTLKVRQVDTNIVRSSQSIFSEIYLSRDPESNCRFFFSIDVKKFIRENALLGNILSNNDQTISELLNYVRVKTLKIYRRRVEGSPNIGSPIREFPGDKSFDPVEKLKKFTGDSLQQTGDIVEDFIVTGGTYDKQFKKKYLINRSRELIIVATQLGNRITTSPSTGDGISVLKDVGLLFQEGNEDLRGLKHITGVDNSVARLTDGYYQYEAEITLENNIADYLSQQKQILMDDLLQIEKIINIAGARSVNEFDTNDKPDPVAANTYGNNGSQLAYYDPVTQTFTNSFIRKLSNGDILKDINPNFWQKFPLDYQAALLKLAQVNLSSDERAKIVETMRSFLNPLSSNLESYIEIASMFKSLIDIYNSALGLYSKSQNHKDERNETQKSRIESTDPTLRNNITMSYVFGNVYNASVPSYFGNMFFKFNNEDLSTDTVGLRVINQESFNSYRDTETKKLFNSLATPVEINFFPKATVAADENSYTYFTPSVYYNRDNEPVYVAEPNTEPAKYDQLMINKLRDDNRQTNKSLEGPKGNSEDEDNKIADFFADNFGLTAQLNNPAATPIILPGNNNLSNLQDRPLDECGVGNDEDSFKKTSFANADQKEQWKKSSSVFKSLMMLGVTIAQQKPQGQLPVQASVRLSLDGLDPSTLASDQDINDAYIRALPNQVKAMIVFQNNNQDQTFSPTPALNSEATAFLSAKPFGSVSSFQKARYLFSNIAQLEVLTGYEMVKYKNHMERTVKAPVWKPLTKALFLQAQNAGRTLMCRLVPYNNEKLKIAYNQEEVLPILDEFFFLGNVIGQDVDAPLGEQIVSDNLSLGLNNPSYQSTNFRMLNVPSQRSGRSSVTTDTNSPRSTGSSRAVRRNRGTGGSY